MHKKMRGTTTAEQTAYTGAVPTFQGRANNLI